MYFGRSIPWIIIDAIPYFRKWKLQPNKVPTAAEQWACTKQVLFSHFTIELPLVRGIILGYPYAWTNRSCTFMKSIDLALPPYRGKTSHEDISRPLPRFKDYGSSDLFLFLLRGLFPLRWYVTFFSLNVWF